MNFGERVAREEDRSIFAEVPREAGDLLAATRETMAELEPHAWVRIADFLNGMLRREPLASSEGWAAHRMLLGTLELELRQAAIAAGEPAYTARVSDNPTYANSRLLDWR